MIEIGPNLTAAIIASVLVVGGVLVFWLGTR